jgi:hypothetical protein
MAVAWPATVNTDAYGLETTPIENVERILFESGKERTYLKNSSGRKRHAFMLSMEDVGDDSEYKTFLDWYNDTLLSGSLTFNFPNLITHTGTKEYKLLNYTASGQKRKEVTLEVEEA